MQNSSVMAEWQVTEDSNCEFSLSQTPIDSSYSLNTLEKFRIQKQACEYQLKKLQNLQKQVQHDQTDVINKKNAYDKSKTRFDQCHQFGLTTNSCSAKEQKQTYQALHKALQAYQKSKQVLIKHQQQMTEVNKQFIQEQEALKSIAKQASITTSPTEINISNILAWIIKAIVIIVSVFLLLFFIWWVIENFIPSLQLHVARIMASIIIGITVSVSTTIIAYYLFDNPEVATVSGIILAIAVHYFMKEV